MRRFPGQRAVQPLLTGRSRSGRFGSISSPEAAGRIRLMSSGEGDEQARNTADAVARRSYGKLIAFLAARTRDVASVEDALSEAFAAALADWPVNGCPAHPEGWLLTAARGQLAHFARGRRTGDLASGELQRLAEELETATNASTANAVEIPDQ